MKKYILIIIAVALYGNISAQDFRNEISLYGAGGLASLNYKLDAGSRSARFGGLAGIGYTWFINSHWGLVTGAELAFYSAKATLNDNYGGSYQAESGTSAQPGNDFTFAYSYKGYSEKQTAMYVQIPVMGQFQTGIFYIAGGVKVGFPVSSEYKICASSLATSGTFPTEGQTYNTLPDRGMGDYGTFSTDGDLKPGVDLMLALETGVKWTLSERMNLYAGVYFDYGLNSIAADSSNAAIVEYDRQVAGKLEYHSITSLADKMNTIAVGLKVKIAYRL